MTFSKVVSGMGGAPSGLLKSGTNIASKSGKDWVSYGGRRADLDPALTFWAQLNRDTRDVLGAADTFTRASDGLYLPYNGADWRIAGANAPRHEDGKILMEPAITNKCTNYNANPDAGLTNLTKTGDAASVMSRVDDTPAIAAAGLDKVCGGFAVDLDNTAGVAAAFVQVAGITANTNPHSLSFWGRKISGASDPTLLFQSLIGPVSFSNTAYERVVSAGVTPGGAGNVLSLRCPVGVRARFVLNQLEESAVVTSPIITQGASGTRAIDTLQWADSASFFNQAQGMAIMRFNPQFAKTDFPGIVEGLLTMDASRATLLYYDTAFRSRDGTNTAAIATPNFAANDNIYLASLYGPVGPGTFQVGYKVNGGSWVWLAAIPYDGSFPVSLGVLKLAETIGYPTRFSSIELYNENRGTAWVEANYQ